LGVDLGGTKIEIIALDAVGAPLLRRRVPSPAHDYDAIVDAIGKLVEDAEAELQTRASVGVATPGAPSQRDASGDPVMKNANSTVLIGRPLARDLSRRLARDVRIENDANCFALSEASDGAAAEAACVLGVILGTGVGSGIVVDRRILRGRNAIAGEWGHNPLPWPADVERPGPPCYCGKRGCIETFLSGPGLSRDFGANGGEAGRGVPWIVAAAREGHAAASAALERYYDRLTRALAAAINLLDPDAIVLGGGVSNIEALYREVPRRLGAYVFSDRVETAVLPPRHGDSSGVRGAAWLWPPIAKPAPHA
jgi:fructokinase